LEAAMGFITYFKLDGVDGDCTDEGLQGWMVIDSFNHMVSGPQPRGGVPILNDLQICRFADRATPVLALTTAEGRLYRSAILRMVRTDGARDRMMEMKFSNVVLTMHSLSGGNAGDIKAPYETLSLHFDKIEWVFYPTPSAPVKTGYSADAMVST
jgi:type VI secretion system secreted protein Hcp